MLKHRKPHFIIETGLIEEDVNVTFTVACTVGCATTMLKKLECRGVPDGIVTQHEAFGRLNNAQLN